MPRPAFFKTLSPDRRRALDNEIRMRAYGDFVGLSRWLADRGVSVHKSVVGAYAQSLKKVDSAASIDDPLIILNNAALAASAHLLADPPRQGFTAAARRQLQDALTDVITSIHRCRIADEAAPA
jgi:hypothetical protein